MDEDEGIRRYKNDGEVLTDKKIVMMINSFTQEVKEKCQLSEVDDLQVYWG